MPARIIGTGSCLPSLVVDNRKLEEIVGVVEGAGTYNGDQVIYVGGKGYYLSDIMAVGKLPPPKDEKPGDGEDDKTDGTNNNTDGTGTDNNTNTDNTTGTDNNTDTEGGASSGADGGAAG